MKNSASQIDDDIARCRRIFQHPKSWETEDLLLVVWLIKGIHTHLHQLPQHELNEYQPLVDELEKELRAIARTHPDVFQVYSKDWTKRVNILEDELGWKL
jgi:hypothetical protein